MTLECLRCGLAWERPAQRGRPPECCPDCSTIPRHNRRGVHAGPVETSSVGLKLALNVTTYRLAIEQATALLRMRRAGDALAVLEQVGAPGLVPQQRQG